jgi:hypothetical protein
VPNSRAIDGYPTGAVSTSTEGSGSERLVLVLTASTISEGLLARGLLQAEGIIVMSKGEAEGPYRIGPMELWVPEEYEIQARMILEEATANRPAPEDP